MKKCIIIAAKTIGIVIALLLSIVIITLALLNIPSVQQRLKATATGMLSDRFNTHIVLDDVSISFVNQCVNLYGLHVDDQRGEQMLTVGRFDAGVDLRALMHGEVVVNDVGMSDVVARIYKLHPDSAMNCQFIVDALKKKPSGHKPKEKKKHAISKFEIKKAWLEDIRCSYEVRSKADSKVEVSLGSAQYREGSKKLKVKNLKVTGKGKTAELESAVAKLDIKQKELMKLLERAEIRGIMAKVKRNVFTTEKITIEPDANGKTLNIANLHIKTNNGKPRKNKGKPNRGAFDAGHIDMTANISMSLQHASKDSIRLRCNNISAIDKTAGIAVDNLEFDVTSDMRAAIISNLSLQSRHTSLLIPAITLLLPSKKDSVHRQEFSFAAPVVKAKTQLADIAKTFAPTLSNFTTTLQLVTSARGNGQNIYFDNIRISTPDHRLSIKASGAMTALNRKQLSRFAFNVRSMYAMNGIKDQILSHFKLKKGLLGLMPKIGDVAYNGNVTIWRKHEAFNGKLTTNVGTLDFDFTIDENTKYLKGEVTSGLIAISKIIDNKNIDDASINASFNFSIMSSKAAKKAGIKHGAFPIGEANGTVLSAGYKGIMLHNINYSLSSDGNGVSGNVNNTGKYIDINCDFSFNDTKNFKNMKLHPSIKLHKKKKTDAPDGNDIQETTTEEKPKEKRGIKKLFDKLKKHKKGEEGTAV